MKSKKISSLKIISSIKEMQKISLNIRKKDTHKISVIPTMGALHEGHLSLIKKAQEKKIITIVTIFVNPIQFDDKNFLTFKTRRNRKLNLTEYYDLVYEYQNDCLVAGIKYKKSYYEDRDLKPSENLFFTISLIPLTNYEQKIDR